MNLLMLHKYASAAVILDAHLARRGGPLLKDSHRHEFEYIPQPGYLYVRSRAISSRINDNWDEFPAEEIRKGWRTFIGKPVFVNHHNDDPARSRGVIVDAALHEDTNPDGTPDTWVEVLMMIDARKFPKLCQAILAREITCTSMGTNVLYSVCTACGNQAYTPVEYCDHVRRLKGKRIRRPNASTGRLEEVIVAERCIGLDFFENSLLVEEPADPTAYFLGVDDRGLRSTAAASAPKVRMSEVRPGMTIEFHGPVLPTWDDRRGEHPWDESGAYISDPTRQVEKKRPYRVEAVEAVDVPTGDHFHKSTNRAYVLTLDGRTVTVSTQQKVVVKDASLIRESARLVPPEKLRIGDSINLGSSMREVVLTQVERGPDGTRVWGPGLPDRGFWCQDGYPVSVNNPGSRGLTDRQMRERDEEIEREWREKHPDEARARDRQRSRGSCPVCSKEVALPNEGQRIPNHNWGKSSSPCLASGKTYDEAVALREDVLRREREQGRWGVRRSASKRQAYGETRMPADVDTLRDDICPVCSERDTFNGSECSVCGYKAPPQNFMHPDTEVAQKVDLRQQNQEPDVASDLDAAFEEMAGAGNGDLDAEFEALVAADGGSDANPSDGSDGKDGKGKPPFLKSKSRRIPVGR